MDGTNGREVAQLITVEELSSRCRLSIATLHRLKRQGKIPFFQPAGKGGRVLFPADAIERAAALVAAPSNSLSSDGQPKHLSGPRPAWMKTPNP